MPAAMTTGSHCGGQATPEATPEATPSNMLLRRSTLNVAPTRATTVSSMLSLTTVLPHVDACGRGCVRRGLGHARAACGCVVCECRCVRASMRAFTWMLAAARTWCASQLVASAVVQQDGPWQPAAGAQSTAVAACCRCTTSQSTVSVAQLLSLLRPE
eukprot:scaffold65178_cov70-Phaeocystis_antarctica.AAC.2